MAKKKALKKTASKTIGTPKPRQTNRAAGSMAATPVSAIGKPEITKIRGLLGAESSEAVVLGLSLLESLGLEATSVIQLLTPETYTAIRFSAHQWLRDGSAKSVENFLLYHRLIVEPRFFRQYQSSKVSKACLLAMVSVPAGSFLMGSPQTEEGRNDDEGQVNVTISSPFRIASSPITQMQWECVMGVEPWWWDGIVPYQDFLKRQGLEQSPVPPPSIQGSTSPTVISCCPLIKFNTGDDIAAFAMSWGSADLFCKLLTRMERACGLLAFNESYSLPSEAEWEYACRATTTSAYAYGESLDLHTTAPLWTRADGLLALCHSTPLHNVPHHLWISGPGAGAVRTKPSNAWGLYDMHGNVDEWCADWYDPVLRGGIDPRGPEKGCTKCLRGGNMHSPPSKCRSASRAYAQPENHSYVVGFRVIARTTVPKSEKAATKSHKACLSIV
jgi:formylglycine-generating enzyme required for sulfatase activity